MDNTEFYLLLAETLDVEAVKPTDVLKDFAEWDSLAVLSVLAMSDSTYGVTIRPEEIRAVVTAADLAKLIESKKQ